MNWDIVAIMDKMIEKATTYKWSQLDSIQREYAIFVAVSYTHLTLPTTSRV